LRAFTLPIQVGDILIFATDGVRNTFTESIPIQHSPQQIADQVLALHSRQTDDALVLVVKFNSA
jgi:phosphoserine phosphatase RsbX